MLGDAQFVPQAADFNDCKHQRKDCTGRTHPGPEDPSGFCVLLRMICIEDSLLLICQFCRYDDLLSILVSDLSSLRRLFLRQEDTVDQDQDDHYDQRRHHCIEDVTADDPGISPLQGLGHGENDLVQALLPASRHNPITTYRMLRMTLQRVFSRTYFFSFSSVPVSATSLAASFF